MLEKFIHQFVGINKLQRRVDRHLSIHGISLNEYIILRKLSFAINKTLRRTELAEVIGVTASGVTRLLAPMEKTGLIEKRANPKDARVSLVVLSSGGETLFENATITFRHVVTELTNDLSDRQLENLEQLLSKIV